MGISRTPRKTIAIIPRERGRHPETWSRSSQGSTADIPKHGRDHPIGATPTSCKRVTIIPRERRRHLARWSRSSHGSIANISKDGRDHPTGVSPPSRRMLAIILWDRRHHLATCARSSLGSVAIISQDARDHSRGSSETCTSSSTTRRSVVLCARPNRARRIAPARRRDRVRGAPPARLHRRSRCAVDRRHGGQDGSRAGTPGTCQPAGAQAGGREHLRPVRDARAGRRALRCPAERGLHASGAVHRSVRDVSGRDRRQLHVAALQNITPAPSEMVHCLDPETPRFAFSALGSSRSIASSPAR